MASEKTRSFICVGVSCLFTIVYAGWIILLQQQQIHLSSLIWFALVMIMCAHSPWVQPIQMACVRAILPLISYAMAKNTTTTDANHCMKEEPAENQRRYRFELYHHQRWWFPTGWSNLLLPQDRAVWTDAHLEAAPSINNFCLPPKTTSTLPDTNQQKIVSWTWVDPEWSRYQDATTDKGGWEYGNWHWKQWAVQSIGLGICTRRQKWYRDAQRTECLVQLPTNHHHHQQQEEVIHWDNQSITTNNSSSGNGSSLSGIMTPVDPIIVSFDNKGERMLRRRSSNLSNKSVIFNNTLEVCSNSPSADDLYNKYCKSPKPQVLKRFSI
ncbi:uncharacterized protein ATC70_003570 [Mucor velutinosus]|uniref:TECPR1-like DysF domain-containing protein n=1 Tax=Mucor velutinosus TaxID=708070 RepID=A0AAN7DDR0_9FUNG|nr:hypothetical protein ATC70_003570 [Mucor velutinosus]